MAVVHPSEEEFKRIQNPKRKTKIFHMFNKVTGEFLGLVKWNCGWRQYVTEIETIQGVINFSAGCNREAADFIDKLMKERKEGDL